jgi:hypothetical protein
MTAVETHQSCDRRDAYRHEAFHDGADEFVAGVVPFVREALLKTAGGSAVRVHEGLR